MIYDNGEKKTGKYLFSLKPKPKTISASYTENDGTCVTQP